MLMMHCSIDGLGDICMQFINFSVPIYMNIYEICVMNVLPFVCFYLTFLFDTFNRTWIIVIKVYVYFCVTKIYIHRKKKLTNLSNSYLKL